MTTTVAIEGMKTREGINKIIKAQLSKDIYGILCQTKRKERQGGINIIGE
jgi:hypothetical protein